MNKRLLKNLRRIACLTVVGLLASNSIVEMKADSLLHNDYDLSGMLDIYKETKNTLVINGIEVERNYITRNYSTYRKDIKYIVVHDTDNKAVGANAAMHTNYYQNNTRGASAHYTVDDKAIVNNVRDEHSSQHVGDGKGKYGITNSNSIGVEMCVNADGDYDKAFKNTQALVKYLMEKYNIPIERVVKHQDASGKMCPKTMIEKGLWDTFKAGLVDNYDLSSDVDKDLETSSFTLNESVDLFKEASWISESIIKLEKGTYVQLLGQDSQWSKVEMTSDTGDKKIGFVPNTTIEGRKAISKAELKVPTYLRITKSWSAAPYDLLINSNEELDVYETDDEWTLVSYNGTYGYLSTDMLKMK